MVMMARKQQPKKRMYVTFIKCNSKSQKCHFFFFFFQHVLLSCLERCVPNPAEHGLWPEEIDGSYSREVIAGVNKSFPRHTIHLMIITIEGVAFVVPLIHAQRNLKISPYKAIETSLPIISRHRRQSVKAATADGWPLGSENTTTNPIDSADIECGTRSL